MSTLPGPATNQLRDSAIEKKAYTIAEQLSGYLAGANAANRLGYLVYLYFIGEGDEPEVFLRSGKFSLRDISRDEFLRQLKSLLDGKPV